MQAPSYKTRTGSQIAIAICQLLGAVIAAVFFGVVALGTAIFGSGRPSLAFLAGAVLAALLVISGLQGLSRIGRAQKITKVVGKQGGRMRLDEIAQQLGMEPQKLYSSIGVMFARKLFAQAQVDLERKELVIGVSPSTSFPEGETIYKEASYYSPMPIFYFGATFLGCAAVFSLSSVSGMITAIIISTGILVFTAMAIPRSKRLVEIPRPHPAHKPAKTGNSDVDTLLDTAMENLSQLKELDQKITNPEIEGQVSQMVNTAWEIIDYVKEHPDKARQVRQFLNYYLPTTVKLLTEYTDFDSQQVQTGNMQKSMDKIEDIVQTILDAFKRELDNLYVDKAVDISAEIEVMRGMLRQEGLDAADITKQ